MSVYVLCLVTFSFLREHTPVTLAYVESVHITGGLKITWMTLKIPNKDALMSYMLDNVDQFTGRPTDKEILPIHYY